MKQDLALLGGSPAIPYGSLSPQWPIYDHTEEAQLQEVLQGSVWGATGLGPKINEFNERWASYCGVCRSVLLANGTVTMELSLRALGIGPGMEVLVPAWSFMATVDVVLQVGAIPVFVDVDPDTLCIDPIAAEAAISPMTRAIIPVHYAGHPCDMDAIMELANRYQLRVIEDAAQAHGAIWRGAKMGCFGDCGSYSFQQSKNLQCGEGGSVVTNDKSLADRLHFSLSKFGRGIGVNYEPFTHYELAGGANATEFQAAILLAQLQRLEQQTIRRVEGAKILRRSLAHIEGIQLMRVDPRVERHGYHLFLLRYQPTAFGGLPKSVVAKAICAEGVPCTPLLERPLYEEPMYDLERMTVRGSDLKIRITPCPVTKQVARDVLAISQITLLADRDEIAMVGAAIQKVQKGASQLK